MFIRGEAMDIGVQLTDTEAAILSRMVEVYIRLRMCTSIRAISERILLHCSLTSALGDHASRRGIVEKAIALMHDAMQDDGASILYMTAFIALRLDLLDRQRHRINKYAILLVFHGTNPSGMCEVFLGMVGVVCGDAYEVSKRLESLLLPDSRPRLVGEEGRGICSGQGFHVGVRGASARQAVDVSTIVNNVFAMIGHGWY